MNRFRYVAPQDLGQALEFLSLHRGKARILAGGTDLTPQIKEGILSPRLLLDVKGIRDLYGIQKKDGTLVLGALHPLGQLINSSILREEVPSLVQAMGMIGSYQIRNRATLGGNLCNASPAADTAPPLLALGASLILRTIQGSRSVPLERFFLGPGKTVLEENEILTHIEIPLPEKKVHGVFLKHTGRKAMDLAIVNVAALASFDPDGDSQDVRIALGAVAPTPMRATQLERILEGEQMTPEMIKQAREEIKKEVSPITDLRASLEYRREMAGVMLERALTGLRQQEETRRDA
jgi:CO/xanthine dehydrogenase FAD-binding subunit